MIQIVKLLTIFFVVSTSALFFMKGILWTLLQWGAKFAVPLALILCAIYVWSFFLVKSIEGVKIPKLALVWIWAIGFSEILLLGGLYHLTPQNFPSFVGEFFFN